MSTSILAEVTLPRPDRPPAAGERRLVFRGGSLPLGQGTLVMGVVNVTPDSFSDGGLFLSTQAAVEQGVRLWEEGAHLLDVGGESTRPGSDSVPVEEEIRRVVPVIQALAAQTSAVISIDTMKAPVARAALEAGAAVINDVAALRFDPDMAALAAESGAGLILMHMLGSPKTMQANPVYEDVVAEVTAFLAARAGAARAAGVPPERIVVDPGIGFGKTLAHNLTLIRRLDRLAALGYPVLLGASRKAFIGTLTGRPALERLYGTLGVHVLGAALGADLVRVHDVGPLVEALKVVDAVLAAGEAS